MKMKWFLVFLLMVGLLSTTQAQIATSTPAPCGQESTALDQATSVLGNARLDHQLARAAMTNEVQAAAVQGEAVASAKYEQARAAYMACEQHKKAAK